MEVLKNKVALITGGSKGIGRGMAEAFLDKGMCVAITSRTLNSADSTASDLGKLYPGKIIGIKADVRYTKPARCGS